MFKLIFNIFAASLLMDSCHFAHFYVPPKMVDKSQADINAALPKGRHVHLSDYKRDEIVTLIMQEVGEKLHDGCNSLTWRSTLCHSWEGKNFFVDTCICFSINKGNLLIIRYTKKIRVKVARH